MSTSELERTVNARRALREALLCAVYGAVGPSVARGIRADHVPLGALAVSYAEIDDALRVLEGRGLVQYFSEHVWITHRGIAAVEAVYGSKY